MATVTGKGPVSPPAGLRSLSPDDKTLVPDRKHGTRLPLRRDLEAGQEAGAPVETARHRDRLAGAAKAAGATGKLTKASAAEHLLANVTDANRGAIAKALGVTNGPNLHNRVLEAIRTMASKPGASAILAGIVGAGMGAADPAEAADGTPRTAGDRLTDAAITGGAAGGTAYGATKLAPHAVKALAQSLLGRAVLRAVPPVAAGMTVYDVGNYMARSAVPAPENDAFAEQYAKTHPRFDPDAIKMARDQERQRLRMPLESAASLEVPPELYYGTGEQQPQMTDGAIYGGETPAQGTQGEGIPPETMRQITDAQMQQLVNALAPGQVAQQGSAFPQELQDPRRAQMVEALMSGAY